jgi:hypothetical protein
MIPQTPKPAFITNLSQFHNISSPLPISIGSISIQSSYISFRLPVVIAKVFPKNLTLLFFPSIVTVNPITAS